MTTQNDLIRRIHHLRNLATHPNTPEHEAEAAFALMHKLQIKHAIDDLMLEDNQLITHAIIEHTVTLERNSMWRVDLYSALALNNMCRAINVRGHGFKTKIYIIGRRNNVDRVLSLYNDYAPVIERRAATIELPYYANPKSYRTAYRAGLVAGLNRRMIDERRNLMRDFPDTNALVQIMDKEVDHHTKLMHPNVKIERRATGLTDGYTRGFGHGINLHATKEIE